MFLSHTLSLFVPHSLRVCLLVYVRQSRNLVTSSRKFIGYPNIRIKYNGLKAIAKQPLKAP